MEPTSAFATIVGLLSAFSSGRDVKKQADLQEFLEWLSEHNFNEIRDALVQNRKSAIEIKTMLSSSFGELNSKLDQISLDLSRLETLPDEFVRLANSIGSDQPQLSHQALEILRLFANREIQRCYTVQYLSEDYPSIDFYPKKISWSPVEPQYLEQDLNLLSEVGYFEYTERNHSKEYQITRLGAAKAAEIA